MSVDDLCDDLGADKASLLQACMEEAYRRRLAVRVLSIVGMCGSLEPVPRGRNAARDPFLTKLARPWG